VDVVDLILDKGLVIDVFVRVSLVGIELITIDARIVVASVDTYLRFAEATNRLDLEAKGRPGLPDLVGELTERGTYGGARGKARGMVEAAKEGLEALRSGDSGEEEEEPREARRERPRRRRPE
jgi:gas vesicle structural protein